MNISLYMDFNAGKTMRGVFLLGTQTRETHVNVWMRRDVNKYVTIKSYDPRQTSLEPTAANFTQ